MGDRLTGWIACGVIGDDESPLVIRPGDWNSATYLGSDPSWVAFTGHSNRLQIHRPRTDPEEIEIRGWNERIMSISFEADTEAFTLSAHLCGVTVKLIDMRDTPDRFYRLRPAVLLAGQASAQISCSPAQQSPPPIPWPWDSWDAFVHAVRVE
jgi:hypothetical protein